MDMTTLEKKGQKHPNVMISGAGLCQGKTNTQIMFDQFIMTCAEVHSPGPKVHQPSLFIASSNHT